MKGRKLSAPCCTLQADGIYSFFVSLAALIQQVGEDRTGV